MSGQAMADHLGITRQRLSKIEFDGLAISRDYAMVLATVYSAAMEDAELCVDDFTISTDLRNRLRAAWGVE